MHLEIDEGFIAHRKTLRFCAMMQDQNAFAYMLRLWSWATRSAPTGDLAGMDQADIEMVIQYRQMDGKCYRALVVAGFIDTDVNGSPAQIHNWAKRTGGAIARMEAAAKASRTRKERWRERLRNAEGTPEERDGDAEGTPENGAGTHTDKTSPVQSSPVKTSPDDQRAPARPRDPWPSWRWYEKFKAAWVPAHGKIAYGDGDDDAKATGELTDKLNSLPADDRLAAEAEALVLFERYFAIKVAAGHPWKWFVQRFNEIRVPAAARASPARDVRIGHGRAEEIQHTKTGVQEI